jgi:hypothetical protein
VSNALLLTWPPPLQIIYGTPLGTDQNQPVSAWPGTAVYAPPNGTVLPAGTNLLTVVFTPADTNFAATNLSTWLVVHPAPLVVAAADTNKVYGQTLAFAGNEYTAAGLVNSDSVTEVSLSSAGAAAAAAAGDYSVTVTNATGAGLTNYSITYSNGVLTVIIVTPTILSLKDAGTSNVVLSWSAVSNVTYRVQYQANLVGTNWVDLAPDVTAMNTTASATNNPVGAPVRFYRIMIVP